MNLKISCGVLNQGKEIRAFIDQGMAKVILNSQVLNARTKQEVIFTIGEILDKIVPRSF